MYSLYPNFSAGINLASFGKTFGAVFRADMSGINLLDFIVIMFAFLFVDVFDTLGTLIGVATKADMLDEDGKLPAHQGCADGRRCCHLRRRCFRYIHHHHLRGGVLPA